MGILFMLLILKEDILKERYVDPRKIILLQ